MDDWTIVLSGPVSGREAMTAALGRTGVLDGPHHNHGLPAHAVPDDDHPADDPTIGFLVARTPNIDAVVGGVVKTRGWVLRAHWPTPRCGVCDGKGQVNGPADIGLLECVHCDGVGRTNTPAPTAEERMAAIIDDLQRRLAAVEAGR